MAEKLKLTYFDIAGAGEQVRLAFTLAGLDFEDERIAHAQWAELKPKSKFGQLPLLTIGEGENAKVFAQSGAMLRYAGEKCPSLYPTETFERFKVEEMMGLVDDFQKAWAPCLYIAMRPSTFGHADDFAKTDAGQVKVKELRENFIKTQLPVFLKYFAESIGENGGFLCSKDEPTLPDCSLFPRLLGYQAGFIDHVPTTCLDEFPEIVAYLDRMKNHPKIRAYMDKSKK